MIFIDLQKAFNTIDHQILIKKMKYLGFSKNAFAWFKSYFSEPKFKININTSYSSSSNLICGVPMDPFYNHLPQAVASDPLLYVDDTCIVFQDKNVTEIEKQLLRDISSLCD